MATKETVDRSVVAWTTRHDGRARVEAADSSTRWVGKDSEGQGPGAPAVSGSPAAERGNEPRPAYRQGLRHHDDALCVNVGTADDPPPGDGQPAPSCRPRGGASVVVRDRESRSHGEGRQSDAVHRPKRTRLESRRVNGSKMAEKQRTLAVRASRDPEYRFRNLYSLLHWEYWIRCAAQSVQGPPEEIDRTAARSPKRGTDGPRRDTSEGEPDAPKGARPVR